MASLTETTAVTGARGPRPHGLMERFAAWRRARKTYNALVVLDDAMLNDIGIERSQIRSVAYGNEQLF